MSSILFAAMAVNVMRDEHNVKWGVAYVFCVFFFCKPRAKAKKREERCSASLSDSTATRGAVVVHVSSGRVGEVGQSWSTVLPAMTLAVSCGSLLFHTAFPFPLYEKLEFFTMNENYCRYMISVAFFFFFLTEI